ncbi:MAG: ABC transporter permease, partial [Chloroflexia bacterium]|nr:ABC transporter permease [Chloroflexia bacterium]
MRPMPARQRIAQLIKKNGSAVVILLLVLFASIFVNHFFSVSNFALILKQAAIPVIASLGMTVVLMTGGIDLSLGYMIGLSSISVGLLVKTYEAPIAVSILATLALGALVGLFNGFCVQKIKVPAFITTLGTGFILLGVAQIISNGAAINHLPKEFLAIGKTKIGLLNTTVFISLGFCALFFYVLHLSTFGRTLAAFGFSEPASRLSGCPTARLNVSVYVISSVLASVAGILLSMDVNCAQLTMGGGDYTFQVITAAVLGGVSLYGGVGSVPGAVFGVLSLKIINNCINLLNVPYYWG